MPKRGTSRFRVVGAAIALVVALFAAGAAPAVANGDDPVVTAPDNFRVDVGASSVTVEWDPSTSDAEIVLYTGKIGTTWFWTEEPTMTFHLQKSRTYTLSVQAQDAAFNRSDWSEPVEFTTSDEFPVTTPSNVQVSHSQGEVTVQWDRSASDAGVMDYVATLSGGRTGPVAKRTTDNTATFTYPPGGDLEVTVGARDHAYRLSDISDAVEFTLAPADDWQPPSTPTNFRGTASQDGVLFQWDEPAEGIGPFTYNIFLDGDNIETIRDDLQLDSPYFTECTRPGQSSAEFTISATSNGFASPRSEPITLCFN